MLLGRWGQADDCQFGVATGRECKVQIGRLVPPRIVFQANVHAPPQQRPFCPRRLAVRTSEAHDTVIRHDADAFGWPSGVVLHFHREGAIEQGRFAENDDDREHSCDAKVAGNAHNGIVAPRPEARQA